MPRYFFDLAGHETARDGEGTELLNDSNARVQAVLFAGTYLKDHPELVWDGREIRVHVLTPDETPLFSVVVVGVDATEARRGPVKDD